MSGTRPVLEAPRAGDLKPRLRVLLLAAVVLSSAASCRKDGCVGGDDGACVPPTPCTALHFSCDQRAATLSVVQVGDRSQRPSGSKALAAIGDYLLENGLVRAVIDAPDHPHHWAPSGGSIIDLAPIGSATGDQTNAIYQVAGILPRDAVHYESASVEQSTDDGVPDRYAAVIVRGHLESDRRVAVVTRYELRPCEPGLRVRTDLFNGAPDANTLYLADAFFWGDQALAPFAPGIGLGFRAPDLEVKDVPAAWKSWPLVAARSQGTPDTSYAVVACNAGEEAGFSSPTVTAAGQALQTTLPGDGTHYDRFIVATPGPGVSPAVDKALLARAMLNGEPMPVTVSGRVVVQGAPFDGRSGRAASLLFYEPAPGPNPDDETRRYVWSEAVPGPDGRFALSLPPNRSYRIQPYAFGHPAGPATSFAVASLDAQLGDLTFPPSAHLLATVEQSPGQRATYVELVLVPAGAPSTPAPTFYGLFPGCDPLLGAPDGGSPACNRALTADGRFDLLVPPGQYYVYATGGPFRTIDRAELVVAAGDESDLNLLVQPISDLLPDGVVSGDFHVHGAASYDSSIPDQDRVVSFLAAGIDVVVASDHDVVTTYADTLAALGASSRIAIIPGVEQTPNILWFDVPGADLPKTLGHLSFWPLTADLSAPRNGAPWDELREPGQMMDDVEPLFASAGVRQLNHPYALPKLARDQGLMRAIAYDPRAPIEAGASFAADLLLRAPGGSHRNIDWDVQEIMTGASRRDWLRYRTLWFSMLSQGFVRAGTANSDTHALALEQAGYARNLVFGNHDHGDRLDVDRFDGDVRAGHMIGTNGPVLEVSIDDGMGQRHPPGIGTPAARESFPVGPGAALNISVRAAGWIPVTEARIFVNGRLVQILNISLEPRDLDRTSTTARSYDLPKPIPLSSLSLPASGDAWLVVEAGLGAWSGEDLTHPAPPDTDGDGLPDLEDAEIPMRPGDATNDMFDLQAIAPGVWPTAFSNPFLLDLDGGGWQAPGL